MARITAGIATSHVPAIGAAFDQGRDQDEYWKPVFDAYEWVKKFEEQEDPDVVILCYNDHASAMMLDVVPTFRSVAIYFDPLRTNGDALVARVDAEAAKPSSDRDSGRPAIRVPVCYGGELGPDLAAVAAFSHLSEADVIAAHTARTYRAFMVGFVPGFAYLGIVEERIAMPRRDTPRVRVPIGSVGIAGVQTGIYLMETPGGWQLVGRTALKPFDPARWDSVDADVANGGYLDPYLYLNDRAVERAIAARKAGSRAEVEAAAARAIGRSTPEHHGHISPRVSRVCIPCRCGGSGGWSPRRG